MESNLSFPPSQAGRPKHRPSPGLLLPPGLPVWWRERRPAEEAEEAPLQVPRRAEEQEEEVPLPPQEAQEVPQTEVLVTILELGERAGGAEEEEEEEPQPKLGEAEQEEPSDDGGGEQPGGDLAEPLRVEPGAGGGGEQSGRSPTGAYQGTEDRCIQGSTESVILIWSWH